MGSFSKEKSKDAYVLPFSRDLTGLKNNPWKQRLNLAISFLFKYARIGNKTDAETAFTLMTKHWRMEQPRLVISVTGGAKSFNLEPRLKKQFATGLFKVNMCTLDPTASFASYSERKTPWY